MHPTITFALNFFGRQLKIDAVPLQDSVKNNIPLKHKVFVREQYKGVIVYTNKGWSFETYFKESKALAEAVGDYLFSWYE